ncbi:histidine phosphatase superfamily [Corynascus novoguineensis]|uniref:Histidine phosphatase superfamily n=1 Tax=Corynascus novoguineensis TaxID=1126955 RepID=A0AAN7HK35_9PEZI|nr:histidine phosphatase superfamily [Corynascus novoguineensis]
MPTYVHLVRHAQGFHNLCAENHALPDPDLTPLGKEQCAQLAKTFPYQAQLTHLVASPLRRTIYTCLLSFEPALRAQDSSLAKRAVIALPEVQEVSPLPCDTGSDPAVLAAEFGQDGQAVVDLSLVGPGWNDKTTADSPFAPVMERLEARARRARRWLRALGREYEAAHPGRDAHVAVVTHGGFLHFLTQDWDGMNPDAGTGWANTEWRSYEFVEEEDSEGEARLRETEASWRRRRGSATALTETEQMEMRCAVEGHLRQEWGNGEDKTQA